MIRDFLAFGGNWGIDLLSPRSFSSPVLSPSCFTPIVQHLAGALEDMLKGCMEGGEA